jgi:hypothetical protein
VTRRFTQRELIAIEGGWCFGIRGYDRKDFDLPDDEEFAWLFNHGYSLGILEREQAEAEGRPIRIPRSYDLPQPSFLAGVWSKLSSYKKRLLRIKG